MNFTSFALLLIFVIKLGQSRLLSDTDFHKVEYDVLERGKPVHVDQSYQKVRITGITGTLYVDSLSELQNVTVLSISNNQIDAIEKGALCSSPKVRALELDFFYTREPPALTKDVFNNCENIEELVLGFSNQKDNNIKSPEVQADALENLTSLKELTIRWYNITHLKKKFLKCNPITLTRLILLECNVEKIDDDALEGLRNLEELVVFHNPELDHLPKNLLKGLSKLKILNLAHNSIKDLSWDEFEGLSSLKELALSDNQISSFDVDKIARHLPNLEKISVDRNPPRCKERESIVEQLKKKLHRLTDVTYRFQPAHADSCEDTN